VILGSKERQDLEGFLACQACLDHLVHLVRRETEESRETGALQELEWKVLRDLRDLMDCQDLQVLESQVSKVSAVLPANKDCEEWWAGLALLVPRDTASSVRRYKCRPTEAQARKDKLELLTDHETSNTELITALVVTLHIVVWISNSTVIIEKFVTNIYNFDKRVDFLIRQSIFII